MRTKFVLFLCAALAATVIPVKAADTSVCPLLIPGQGVLWKGTEWNGAARGSYPDRNCDIVSIGREPARTDSIPYADSEEAVLAARNYEKERSPYYRLLSGTDWKFFWLENPEEFRISDVTEFYDPVFDDSDWDTIFVPSVWQTQGYDHPIYTNSTQKFARNFGNDKIGYPRDLPKAPTYYNPIGLYRYTFEIPQEWEGQRVYIDLEGVDSAFYLWINGIQTGYAEDSFTTNEFDITEYVKFGETNYLAAKVYRWCDGSWLEDQDYFDLSGIFRDVYVYATPQVRVRDFSIVTDFDQTYEDAQLQADIYLHNYTDKNASARLTITLLDENGEAVVSEDTAGGQAVWSGTLASGREETVSFRIPVEAPRKWSAEDPYLYTLLIREQTNADDGAEAEGYTDEVWESAQIGFRKITYKTTDSGWYEDGPSDWDLIRINGEPIMFRGVNRHETHPELGYAVTREVMEEDIRIMLENNINAVRTSHYPNSNYWYYLCDKYGIYVVDEANVECHSNMLYENERITEYLSRAVIDREYNMIRRDRNHASVVMWSLGNENKNPQILRTILVQPYEDPEGTERVLHEYTKDRPWHYEQAGTMYETGIDVRSGMYALPSELAAHGQEDGPVPMIECEYEHAMGNSEGNFDEYWEAYDTYRNLQGGFIWDYIDQSIYLTNEDGERYFGYGGDFGEDVHDSNFCANGLLLPDRSVQPEMAEVRYFYQQIRFRDAGAANGKIEIQNFHLFTDPAEKYRLRWELLENNTVLQEGVVDDTLLHIPCVDHLTGQPGSTVIQLPFSLDEQDMKPGCVYFLNLSAELKNDERMLPAGHITALEQFELKAPQSQDYMEEGQQEQVDEAADNQENSLKITYEGTVITITGEEFTTAFDREQGRLIRYTANGRDLIIPGEGPSGSFFRAGTDNDRGMGASLQVFTLPWKNPGQYLVSGIEVQSEENVVTITIRGTYPELNDLQLNTVYRISADGRIHADITILPQYNETFVYIPVAGVQLTVPGEYEQMTWFGRGPEENYQDRKQGTKTGVYKTTVTGNFIPYVKSSETGNRTDVRWITLTDEKSFGLLVCACETLLEFSALHYTPEELDRGVHPFELEELEDTILRLNCVQIGVGGDNAWDRIIPHEQYLPQKDIYQYSFTLMPMTPQTDPMESYIKSK